MDSVRFYLITEKRHFQLSPRQSYWEWVVHLSVLLNDDEIPCLGHEELEENERSDLKAKLLELPSFPGALFSNVTLGPAHPSRSSLHDQVISSLSWQCPHPSRDQKDWVNCGYLRSNSILTQHPWIFFQIVDIQTHFTDKAIKNVTEVFQVCQHCAWILCFVTHSKLRAVAHECPSPVTQTAASIRMRAKVRQ